MIRVYFGLVTLLLSVFLFAQDHSTCNTQRYRVDVFSDVSVIENVKYGEGETIAGNDVDLYMDIYEPLGDLENKRPLVVLAFGGSFITGSKADVRQLCEGFARKGFVAVAIDYRLYDLPLIPLPSASEMQDVVLRAVKDMKTALNFLDTEAKGDNSYGLDMSWVYVGGISSGSITACHTAMLDSTDIFSTEIQAVIDRHAPIDGISDGTHLVDIKGVLNFSGGLHDVGWIDANDPPFISYHENGDATVPYKSGAAQIFGQNIIALSGSYSMDSAARNLGVYSVLNTINANTHVGYFFDAQKTKEIIDESALFMYNMICSETANLVEFDLSEVLAISPNPFENRLTIDIHIAEVGTLKICNTYGLVVLEAPLFDGTNVLDTRKLPLGIYFLQLEIDGIFVTHKLVRN